MAKPASVVGLWYIAIKGAPFERHLFTFHADGTMLQANPDAGDAGTSDSVGMGVWQEKNGQIIGQFVEITANRQTHLFESTGVISFTLMCHGDSLNGQAEANFYDATDTLISGPMPGTLRGTRVRADVPFPPKTSS